MVDKVKQVFGDKLYVISDEGEYESEKSALINAIKTDSDISSILMTTRPVDKNENFFDSMKKLGFGVSKIILKAMSKSEIDNFLKKRPNRISDDPHFNKIKIVNFSLGIPSFINFLLRSNFNQINFNQYAKQTLTISGISLENAADYLSVDFSRDYQNIGRLLDIKELDVIPIPIVNKISFELKDLGVINLSLVAEESLKIYQKVSQEPTEGKHFIFSILIPDLSDQVLEFISGEIGITAIDDIVQIRKASLADIFKIHFIKVKALEYSNKIMKYNIAVTDHFGMEEVRNRLKDLFNIPQGSNEMLISTHGHASDVNPIRIGFMMEVLLQQLGIQYIVKSSFVDKPYYYDPDKKDIFYKE